MSSYNLYKKNIKWNKKKNMFYFSFYHNGKRIYRDSVKWTKSKKHLAEDSLMAICNEIDKNEFVSKSPTFDDVFQQYIEFKQLSVRKNTIATNKRIYRNHIHPKLGNMQIHRVSPDHLAKFFSQLLEEEYNPGKKYSNNLISKVQSLINQIFDYGLTRGHLKSDPSRMIAKVKHNRPESRFSRRYVNIEDVIRVINNLENPSHKLALSIALFTGMRPSEIFGLDFVDDKGQYFEVCSSYSNETQELGPTKNREIRQVAIPEPLRKVLDDYYIWCQDVDHDEFSPLINIVKRQPKTTIDRAIKKSISECGVDKFSWYDLRSTMITNLLQSGADSYIVARNSGHRKSETTDTYALVDIEDQMIVLNNMLNNKEEIHTISILNSK